MKVKGWVVVKAKRQNWGRRPDGSFPVGSLSFVSNVWVNKPTVEADQEAIEIEIDYPDDYFEHSSPKVVVQVPSAPQVPMVATAQVTKGRAPSAAAKVVRP